MRTVAPGVWVSTSRRMTTTTTVVAAHATAPPGGGVLLVDPAWDPDELEALADWLDGHRFTVAAGWSTHAHHDHLLWHPRFGAAPRWATPAAAAAARAHRAELIAELGPDWPAELAGVALVEGLPGGRLPGERGIEVISHPAHAPGHGALWIEDARVLLAGDMLSDVEIPLPEHPGRDSGRPGAGLEDYRAGLAALLPFVRRAAVLVPGHGRVALAGSADTPLDRWRRDLAYLDSLPDAADPRLDGAPAWLLEEHQANRRASRHHT